ncbi:MAG: hypothetical protein J6I73_08980 [Treponema sp.]|nr:hypothetical protein [Treponema sp.]
MKDGVFSKCAAALFAVFTFAFFSSCTASVELRAHDDSSITVAYDASFGGAFIELMRALAGGHDALLFNADEMARQFHEVGIETVRVSSPADASLSVAATVPHNSHDAISQSGCIARAERSMSLICSLETFTKLYESLPPSLQSYIDLFMAPIFSGDAMTKGEYLDLVASVYGKKLADEVAAARVKITMYGGNAKQAYTIPLVELLTATMQNVYSIAW